MKKTICFLLIFLLSSCVIHEKKTVIDKEPVKYAERSNNYITFADLAEATAESIKASNTIDTIGIDLHGLYIDKIDSSSIKLSNDYYKVKEGDNLYSIAEEELGDYSLWIQIFKLNKDKIKNPNLIYPNQVLRLR